MTQKARKKLSKDSTWNLNIDGHMSLFIGRGSTLQRFGTVMPKNVRNLRNYKKWALRKPILDTHIFILSLNKKVQELEPEIAGIIIEKILSAL